MTLFRKSLVLDGFDIGTWCRRRGDLLVYDLMANSSLNKFLFDNPKTILNWDQRLRIIKDVASGLVYLHEGYEQILIHRDIKASNVLLDDELHARLGDFGLTRLYEHGSSPGTTWVGGTMGYLALELPKTGKATTRSGVYQFSALLLEVACGHRPTDPKALPEELVLVDWNTDMVSAFTPSAIFKALFIALCAVELLLDWALAKHTGITRHYKFNVLSVFVTVNGQFPGPRVIAREGDRLLIKVVNHVQYNVTLHWHGIRKLWSG
ncbi:hypothetical protein F3Y22_tig00009009pilonHSYRG00018 [Hibiscus syriacus]|uniref:Protein kinase domain-containing protein n=1 Tax=Hibiscus syriacus TaxID=106335 RepID=A0A6A3CC93_HIBSY|nr:hypothetical protein F3Y22_tig00009009pilonHSYRG00018 [Hibiscus syriacus]